MKNNQQQNPNFFKALNHYKAMVKQCGEEHPIAMQAFMLAFEYSPQWMKDEYAAVKEGQV